MQCVCVAKLAMNGHGIDCLKTECRNAIIEYLLDEFSSEVIEGPRVSLCSDLHFTRIIIFQGSEQFAYIMDVIFPEAVIMLIMHCESVTYEEVVQRLIMSIIIINPCLFCFFYRQRG